MNAIKTIFLAVVTTLTGLFSSLYAQQSVLSSGHWFKLSVERDGVYKIGFDLLSKMGIDPGKTDPRTIKIYGNGGGMLPQLNSAFRPSDLTENAIYVSGEADGRFDEQDFILFYAEGPDKATFDVSRQIYAYENNLYSDKNFYFITAGQSPAKRIEVSEDLGTAPSIVTTYDDFIFHEKDDHNILQSGRQWFGEKFGTGTTEQRLSFAVPGIASAGMIKIVSSVVGQSYSNASFKLLVNNVPVTEQNILPIPNTRYGVKGQYSVDTLSVNAVDVGAHANTLQEIKYQFVKGESTSQGFLDFFLLSFERNLALYTDQTIFSSSKSPGNSISQFEVGSVSGDATIWDVTDVNAVKKQIFSLENKTATFSTITDQLKKFIVFNNNVPAPGLAGKVENQNLRGLITPGLLIVTHPFFEKEAQRLAEHRRTHSNWSVAVVTPEQVYNEFSSGRQDVSAIRDFIKYLYDRNPSTLKALLLVGKSSYDYKDRVSGNTNYVITYESRNSLHPLQTFSSDDYFAFLENNEGTWAEDLVQNHTLDIGVGRLPVTTAEEAGNIVDKIIAYDTKKENLGSWRKDIVFIADDGNTEDGFTALHQEQANQLAEAAENFYGVDTRKLFMGSYNKIVKPNGETVPKLTDDVIQAFERGALIINYTGHGSDKQWGDENFFNSQMITTLKNKLYPFLVTATCEFGRHDDPATVSGAEKCITLSNGGAVGMVTTARPVNATTNFNLNEAFYEALFQREANVYLPIGEVFRRTKNNSTAGVSNRNFSLLGDPSLTLALPENSILITELTTSDGSDTLKALSKVTARGEIRNSNGEKLPDFNGTLQATLFDKEMKFTTIGRNNPPFEYNQWHNVLFRGKATVTHGEFKIDFIIPKNISYSLGNGKLSLYAADPTTLIDASGIKTDFTIGGTRYNAGTDNIPPRIKLFMGDTTFVNGGITTADTHLVAHLDDESGINISSYGVGNGIIAVLDNDTEFYVLNDYYIADTDNYSSGWLTYPLKNLSPGRHTIVLKVWDVFNNSSESKIDFRVTDGEALVIESFGNYPNPFKENTTLFFTHNRSGDDLQAQVFIYTITGDLVKTGEITTLTSNYRVNLMEINLPDDIGKKLPAGLYLARVIVRSLTNGSKNERVTKLIIVN